MTPGTTNPLLGDDCEDIANLDTTPHVMLAEEMPDEDNCGGEGHSGDWSWRRNVRVWRTRWKKWIKR